MKAESVEGQEANQEFLQQDCCSPTIEPSGWNSLQNLVYFLAECYYSRRVSGGDAVGQGTERFAQLMCL
jgi:hypothetical protein